MKTPLEVNDPGPPNDPAVADTDGTAHYDCILEYLNMTVECCERIYNYVQQDLDLLPNGVRSLEPLHFVDGNKYIKDRIRCAYKLKPDSNHLSEAAAKGVEFDIDWNLNGDQKQFKKPVKLRLYTVRDHRSPEPGRDVRSSADGGGPFAPFRGRYRCPSRIYQRHSAMKFYISYYSQSPLSRQRRASQASYKNYTCYYSLAVSGRRWPPSVYRSSRTYSSVPHYSSLRSYRILSLCSWTCHLHASCGSQDTGRRS